MEQRYVCAFDLETELIGPCNLAPRVMCGSFDYFDLEEWGLSEEGHYLLGNHKDDGLEGAIHKMLTDTETVIVGHNVAFDMACVSNSYPDLIPLVFAAYADERITDTLWREKLLNLSSFGALKLAPNPDGSFMKIGYHLADLVLSYSGEDRTEDKTGDSSWRLRYNQLDGKRARDYPQAASKYALQDAEDTLVVYLAQQERAAKLPSDPFATDAFQTTAAFALYLMSCRGMAIDQQKKSEIEEQMNLIMSDEHMKPLRGAGILRPYVPARSYAKPRFDADGNEKLQAAKKASINTKALHELIESVCEEHKIPLKTTDKGKTSADAEVLDTIGHLDPLLELYKEKQAVQKIISTELPRMSGDVIHFNYNAIVETGRTSSYAGNLYPSANGQNIDPRVRPCYVPRKGFVFLSSDYSALELCSIAQTTFDLFGYSIHKDKINAGYDLHAFLGSQLALALDANFQASCAFADATTQEEVYKAFLACRGHPQEELSTFFDHYRKFAKPVGLGFPGGLGAATFVSFAKVTYGVVVTEEEAKHLKEIWLSTYPEMREYFQWVSNQSDPHHPGELQYTSPLGMHRANASYCSVSNGKAMQTPAAEGAKIAAFYIARACYDKTQESILQGCSPVNFVHDEFILELPETSPTERAKEVERIMVESMQVVMPDVAISAESCLMDRWYKEAKTVRDENGNLLVWQPKGASNE